MIQVTRIGHATLETPDLDRQIDYWQDNGGVTYQDPDGREVVFASWIYQPPPNSR